MNYALCTTKDYALCTMNYALYYACRLNYFVIRL